MSVSHADVVICGAGIAGISAAYHLALQPGIGKIILVDERPPLSLTSDKSTEAYRNWWPGPDDAMLGLMNRSIDLLEQLDTASAHRLNLNRRGYLYVTGDPAAVPALVASAQLGAQLGAGPLRVHGGSVHDPVYVPGNGEHWQGQPDGADLLLDPGWIPRRFPYLNPASLAALHVRRAGWFSGQQLGMVLLEQARARGVQLLTGHVDSIDTRGGRVRSVRVKVAGGEQELATPVLVNAAGPLVNSVAAQLGLTLPIFCELHRKMALEDRFGVLPREAPLVIWEDAQLLPWSAEERAALAESAETQPLLAPFPGGIHFRPEGRPGSQTVLMLWAYHSEPVPPLLPLPADPEFPEIVLRGMTTLVPGLAAYLEKLPKVSVDGGYYTKTRENRPLIGPLPVQGAYILAALSGYGLMAACASGELLAAHVAGGALPGYAPAFVPSRYEEPGYLRKLEAWGATGQL